MALITSVSDPALYSTLEALHNENPDVAWIIYGGTHYKVMKDSTNTLAFLAKTNEELFDSRSFTGSRPTTYHKLDDG